MKIYLRPIIITLLICHLMITLYVCYHEGWLCPFPPFSSLTTYQVFSDLIIAISLLDIFILFEMENKNIPKIRFIYLAIGTVLLGSFAPMLFLLWNKELFAVKE